MIFPFRLCEKRQRIQTPQRFPIFQPEKSAKREGYRYRAAAMGCVSAIFVSLALNAYQAFDRILKALPETKKAAGRAGFQIGIRFCQRPLMYCLVQPLEV